LLFLLNYKDAFANAFFIGPLSTLLTVPINPARARGFGCCGAEARRCPDFRNFLRWKSEGFVPNRSPQIGVPAMRYYARSLRNWPNSFAELQ
jgi:hypothetical protein